MKNLYTNFKSKLALIAIFCMMLVSSKSNAQCAATYTYTYDSIGTSIQFFPAVNGIVPVTYQWDFNDGTSSTSGTPIHTYNFNGWVEVCLLATFSNGCTVTYCDSLPTQYVSNNCSASFSYASTPSGISFTNLSTSTDSSVAYSWNFGDGSSSSQVYPQHSYANPGTYTVCLTMNTSSGCSDTFCSLVQVSGMLNCSANFSANSIPGTTVVNFIDASTSTGSVITGYFWDFGDSTISTQLNPAHTYPGPGTYTACLTIQSSNGCTSTICHLVYVGNGNPCLAAFTSYSNPGTNNIDFYDQSTTQDSIVSYFWDYGDGDSAFAFNPSHHYASSGYYYVCLTITSASGCNSTFCDTVYSPQPVTCNANFASQISGSVAVFYPNYISGSAIYTWTFGDGSTLTQLGSPVVTHIYNGIGVYNVCLSIQDSACSSSSCNAIVIGANTACAALYSYTVNSTGTQFSFTNYSTAATNYSWSFGDGTASNQMNPVHTYNQAGPFTVCLTITDTTSGCSDTFCRSVSAANACDPVFYAQPDSANVIGVPMTFTVYSPCGVPSVVMIDFGDGNSAVGTSATINYTYASPGTYYVCVCEVIGTDTLCFCDTVVVYRLSNNVVDDFNSSLKMTTYPNPFNSNLTIEFTLSKTANVQIELVGLAGNVVKVVSADQVQSGFNHQVINTSDLSQGFYLLKMSIGGNQITKKVILQK